MVKKLLDVFDTWDRKVKLIDFFPSFFHLMSVKAAVNSPDSLFELVRDVSYSFFSPNFYISICGHESVGYICTRNDIAKPRELNPVCHIVRGRPGLMV